MRKLAILTITACSLLAIIGCQQQDEDVAVTAVAPEPVTAPETVTAPAPARITPPKMKMTTSIPKAFTAPDEVQTSIGTLKYFDGVPTEESTTA
ncbi:MAG: hypothetical protein WBM65_08775, partial [Sedimenticolaceae bacterium]